MTKFKFECESEGVKTIMEFEGATWVEALDQFIKFLRGVGYLLDNDSVGINIAKHMFAEDHLLPNLTYFQEGENKI